jgi:putative arylsulfatase
MRKIFLPLLSFLPLWAAAQADQKPNIIVLVADDLGYGDLSCYGAHRVQTPTIDSLAAHGVRLTNMHACASTSTPSRYALLTGEYPFRRTGTDVAAGNASMIIRPEQTTVADLMHRAGYATAAIGKWHLGLGSRTAQQDWNGTIDQTPRDLGFDYHYIMAATADRVPCVYIENGRVANYDPSAPISVSYRQNFEGEPTGRSNPELLTKLQPSHGHDMSIVNGISRIGYMKGGGRALWRDEDIADSIMSHAIGFIDSHRSSPFFMYLCTNDVHVPRMPNERFRGKSPMGLRGEAILQFDWSVRQLVDALRSRGLDKNTLLIITSDNGPVLDDGYRDQAVELCGDHHPGGPFRGGKYSAFEAGSAVPFIVYWPAGTAGGVSSDALASLIDVPASLSALVGTKPSANEIPDSQNQLAVWLGQSRVPREYAVSMASNRSLTLRTQHYKYISPSDGGPMITWGPKIETGYRSTPQLYDLDDSNYESADISAQKPKVLQRLQRLLGVVRGGR